MRRLLVILWIALIAAGVWLAVTRFPRAGPREQPSAQPPPPSPQPGAMLERLPVLGGACGTRCGVERWAVKTLADADRDLVALTPVPATIESLASLPPPGRRPAAGRLAPVEVTIYRVRGYLAASWAGNERGTGPTRQDDRDIHVVIFGLQNQRVSMVTEIPDPECAGVCATGLGPLFAAARRELEAILSRPNPTDRPIVIEVTGVGFWDRREHATGAAPNGIELHPVLALREVPPESVSVRDR